MKSSTSFGISVFLAFSIFPLPALAHEQQTFEIGKSLYHFTVGSLNEPVMVDDKTGVDLRVAKVSSHVMPNGEVMAGMDMAGMDHGSSTGTEIPVTGLEKTLKVELKVAGASKVMDLQTVYGMTGAYKAPYYPTRPMQVSYRFFGDLDGHPVDITFTCNPAGHDMTSTKENTDRVDLGNGVVRVSQKGAFGCPAARDDVTFPDAASSALSSGEGTKTATLIGGLALALALAGLALAAQQRRKGITR